MDNSFWSHVFIDSFIAILIFAIFLSIIFIYVLFPLEEHNNVNNVVKSIELYLDKNQLDILVNNSKFKSALENQLNASIITDEKNKMQNNTLYKNQLVIILVFIFAIVIIIFTALSIVNFNYKINWKFIGIIIIINISFILLYELLYLYLCIGKYNITRLNNILKLLVNLPVN